MVNPFGSGSASTADPFTDPSTSGQPADGGGSDVVLGMLASTGLDDFYLIPPEERPELIADATYGWFNGETFGALYIIEDETNDIATFTSLLLAHLDSYCSGEFTYGTHGDTFPSNIPVRWALGNCESVGDSLIIPVIVWQDEMETGVILHIASIEGAERAKIAADNLYEVLISIFSED